MPKSLQEAIYSNLEWKDVNAERKRLAEKWTPIGLLDGIDNEVHRGNMAQLLENQAKQLYKERYLTEAGSQTTDVIGFQSIALPLVRRVFGGLIANQICSVQPLSTPAGFIFYLDYTFANGSKAGVNNKDWTSGGSVFGDPLGKNLASTGAYGSGGHYFLNNSYSRYETTGTIKFETSGSVTAWSDIDFDPDLSGALAASTIKYAKLRYADYSTVILNPDWDQYKSFSFSGTSTANFDEVKAIYKRYTKKDSTHLTFYYSSSEPVHSASNITLSWVRTGAINADTSGTSYIPEFESDFSTDMIPEIDVSVTSDVVVTDTRKLKVKWTPEMSQDLSAYQNVDAEALLTQFIAEQMAMEIDIEVLRLLLNAAAGTGVAGDRLIRYWSAKPNTFVNKKTGAHGAGATLYANLYEWYQTLMKPINELSNEIQRRTLRTGANFIVTSPDVCTILEMLGQYSTDFNADPATTKYAIGYQGIGTLASRYTVYKCPYFPRQTMLIGYKGDDFMTAGAAFCPYVPLIITPTIFAPTDFTPRVGAMSRYGFKVINAGFYAALHVVDMDFM